MSSYYLYGAGKYVEYFVQMILYFGDNVAGILDGDIKKQGRIIGGIRVYPPENILLSGCRVIISCMATEEIREILNEMGIENREMLVRDYLVEKLGKVHESFHIKAEKEHICFDLCSGAEWGGAENWNYFLADKYKKNNPDKSVMLISDEYKNFQSCIHVPIIEFTKDDDICKIVNFFQNDEGVCFVNSFFGHSFFAMLAMKIENPGRVRLITIVHNDYKDLYRICSMFKEFIDCFICVSSKIQKNMIGVCGVQNEKVFFLHQPMEIEHRYRSKRLSGEIKIGVATRLTKQQKRVDYLPGIIDILETKGIQYKMFIAGDGDCYSFLDEFIRKRDLTERVILLGRIAHDKMWDFWDDIDIYLNFSDFEGSSLSMLEAMSSSCVPIVTDVSGARDYIEDGVNGFIVDIGDLDGICEKIEYFSHYQEEIEVMGVRSRNSVIEKCNVDSYLCRFSRILGRG